MAVVDELAGFIEIDIVASRTARAGHDLAATLWNLCSSSDPSGAITLGSANDGQTSSDSAEDPGDTLFADLVQLNGQLDDAWRYASARKTALLIDTRG